MENHDHKKASRKRKLCSLCGQDFSCRQYRRHINNSRCRQNQDADSSEEEREQVSPTDIEMDTLSSTDSEDDMNHEKYLRKIFKRTCANVEVEDQVFFDMIDPENEQNYESDSESVNVAETDEDSDIETELENEVDGLQHWVRVFFLIWQSLYCISDTAVDHMLQFLKVFLLCLGKLSNFCVDLSKKIPKGINNLRRNAGQNQKYTRFVVCLRCKSLYQYDDCVITIEGEKRSKNCDFVEFPHHSKPYLRKACGQSLLKQVSKSNGDVKLVPYKTYNYQSLKSALKRCVSRPGFEEKCEEWRRRGMPGELMTEVYDGKIWKEFCDPEKHNFLSYPNNYALMLNVDWFQPYKHVNYSVGAIYLVILNLPIQERFKKENVILVGIIPNFDKEPPTNTFLQPLVEELLEAWTVGFSINSYLSKETPKLFKLALLCCGCDIPAGRKVCGFLGHMATKGCNRCYKEFPGMVGEKTFGGFDREEWVARDADTHKKHVTRVQNANTKTKRSQLESQFGVRESVLLQLPYFDPIRMTIVDPMHNLFLGTAKHQIRVWKDQGIIETNNLEVLQSRVDQIQCPTDVGNIPHKIASGFSELNADQLKNWTLLFSMFALRGILNIEQLRCWQKFVLACKWLCTKVLTVQNVQLADSLLLSFCKSFERIYGMQYVTPNMHMHCHLAECVLDFGPIYGFWLFSFERYNGTLGNYPTNKRDIEAQLFRRFLNDFCVLDFNKPVFFAAEMEKVFSNLNSEGKKRGSLLSQTKATIDLDVITKSSSKCNVSQKEWDMSPSFEQTIRTKKIGTLSQNEVPYLRDMYRYLYGNVVFEDDFIMCPSYVEAKEIYFMENVLGSRNSRSRRSSVICAHWCNEDGSIHLQDEMNLNARPGQVQKYILHRVIYQRKEKFHVLAKVCWYADLPQRWKKQFNDLKPTEAWADQNVDPGSAMFIPVQRIKCKAVSTIECFKGKNVLFVCPRDRYLICS